MTEQPHEAPKTLLFNFWIMVNGWIKFSIKESQCTPPPPTLMTFLIPTVSQQLHLNQMQMLKSGHYMAKKIWPQISNKLKPPKNSITKILWKIWKKISGGFFKASAVIPPKMLQSAELYSQPIPRYVSSAHYATNQCHLMLYSEMSSGETEEHLGAPCTSSPM